MSDSNQEWHRIAALLLFKLRRESMTITAEDVRTFNIAYKRNIVCIDKKESSEIRLVSDSELEEMKKR